MPPLAQTSPSPHEVRLETAFVSRLTHDLRVPFAAVRSALYLLERHGQQVSGPREKKWIEAASTSLGSFERLLRAVDAHLQALNYVLPSSLSCDLHEVVRSNLALAHDEYPGREPLLKWDVRVARIQPVDGNMVATVVRQLLDNAVRLSPVGQKAELHVAGLPNGWELAVSNEGPAIPANEHARLFTPFFHSQSHLAEQGPGLGLSTAAIAAEKTGCKLSYERIGARSYFFLRYRSGA